MVPSGKFGAKIMQRKSTITLYVEMGEKIVSLYRVGPYGKKRGKEIYSLDRKNWYEIWRLLVLLGHQVIIKQGD